MNKRGEVGVGILLTVAVGVILALVLFQSSAQQMEKAIPKTATGVNDSLYTGILNTKVELVGQELVSVENVTNRTTGIMVYASNYTIAECVRTSDGLKGICYTAHSANASYGLNISYTYYPAGYIDDAGARGVAGIIILLTAIAVALVMLPAIRNPAD